MTLTMVIPIFNEGSSLPQLLERILKIHDEAISFLLVDNGSTQSEVLEILARGGRNWTSIRLTENRGFGGAIRAGVIYTDSDFVGWMPGNLKIDPLEFWRIFSRETAKSGTSAWKFKRVRSSKTANFKTLLFGLIQSFLLRRNMMDSGGTPTIISRPLADKLASHAGPNDYLFESFVYLFLRENGIAIKRPKITYGLRKHGSSHWQNGLKSELSLLTRTLRLSSHWQTMFREEQKQ